MAVSYFVHKLSVVVFLVLIYQTCCQGKYTKALDECKAWSYRDANGNCKFGKKHVGIVKRYKDSNCSLLQIGYCMTSDNYNMTYVMPCPYDVAWSHNVYKEAVIMNTTLENLNNFTCSHLNRKNIKHCSQCIAGHGQSVYTLNMSCFECSGIRYGWTLYFLSEFTLQSIFIITILIFQITPTKPNVKVFVLYSQLISVLFSMGYGASFKHMFHSTIASYVTYLKVCYGFWNLDIFRDVIPGFCVSTNLTNLHVLMLQYLPVVFLTLLTATAWTLVDFHERGFRVVVYIWRPFRRFLSHYSVTNDPKRSIISFLATVVILSYTRVLYLSGNILNMVKEYKVYGGTRRVLFIQPDVGFFSGEHIPFVFVSLIMLLLYVIFPLLLLILYPLEFFQAKLNKLWVRSNNIQIFVESFYGCYNDGSNETKDRRLFSTAYLFHRIIFVLLFIKISYPRVSYSLMVVMQGIFVAMIYKFKPYKQNVYNILDSFFLLTFAFPPFFVILSINSSKKIVTNFLFSAILSIATLPLLYAKIRVLQLFYKFFRYLAVQSFDQWRRRGYAEVQDYANQSGSSIDNDWK